MRDAQRKDWPVHLVINLRRKFNTLGQEFGLIEQENLRALEQQLSEQGNLRS